MSTSCLTLTASFSLPEFPKLLMTCLLHPTHKRDATLVYIGCSTDSGRTNNVSRAPYHLPYHTVWDAFTDIVLSETRAFICSTSSCFIGQQFYSSQGHARRLFNCKVAFPNIVHVLQYEVLELIFISKITPRILIKCTYWYHISRWLLEIIIIWQKQFHTQWLVCFYTYMIFYHRSLIDLNIILWLIYMSDFILPHYVLPLLIYLLICKFLN